MGDTWCQMLAKCMIVVTGEEAKEACGMEQLCGEMEAVIKGGIHAVRLLWQQNSQEEDWGFILIDARNGFNEENQTAMLWEVRHKWISGVRFLFNCYYHWATLVIRAGNGTDHFLYSKEVVTQGYPLAMVAYRLGTPPSPGN